MVAKAAAGLISSDVRATDVVAILIEDPLEHWLATMAVAHMGATVFCVSKSMSVTQRELLLSRTHCGWLLSDQREVSSSLRQINWSDIRNVKDNGPSTPAIVDANKPWIYVSGSGSTGQPKILPVTHEQQLHRANLALNGAPKFLRRRWILFHLFFEYLFNYFALHFALIVTRNSADKNHIMQGMSTHLIPYFFNQGF